MTKKEIAAWLAGLIDGEGSIMLNKRRCKASRGWAWRPVVTIYNTDIRLMTALVERVGGGSVYTHRRPEKENHKKTAYSWHMTVIMMREWLPLTVPFMIVKREQAELMQEHLRRASMRNPHSDHWWKAGSATDDIDLCDKIRSLNTKGRHHGES